MPFADMYFAENAQHNIVSIYLIPARRLKVSSAALFDFESPPTPFSFPLPTREHLNESWIDAVICIADQPKFKKGNKKTPVSIVPAGVDCNRIVKLIHIPNCLVCIL